MKGFTLIEIIIVLAILFLLAVLVIPPFSDFRRHEILRSTAFEVEALLQQARSQTLASKNDSNFGVWFGEDRVVVFAGNEFDENDLDNRVVFLSTAVMISDIALSDDSAFVVFERLTGEASFHGQVELSLVSNPTKTRIVNISRAGVIETK